MDSSTGDKTHKGTPWEGSGKKNRDKRDMFSPYKEPNLGIVQSLTKSPSEIPTTKSRKDIHEASQNGVQGKRYIQESEKEGPSKQTFSLEMDSSLHKSRAGRGWKRRSNPHD
ncbi:hypothetical protein Tco_1567489 [Tanacetum coccineum]